MVITICFADKAACISTHGWFTIFATIPHEGKITMTELLTAGLTNEIALPYNVEEDDIDYDPNTISLEEMQSRLLHFWDSLTPDEMNARKDEFLSKRNRGAGANTEDEPPA